MSEAAGSPAWAVVVGAGGGIGSAVLAQLRSDARYARVLALGRRGEVAMDLTDEASIAAAATQVAQALAASGAALRLVVVASGVLQNDEGKAEVNADVKADVKAEAKAEVKAEKGWRELDAGRMARSFAVNAIGPALLMKHLLPLLPREGRSVFAAISAKVGSIGDNRLGGWYSYRASKAALNQLVHTAAIELARSRPQAVCVVLHPGTVDTALSQPFHKSGLALQTPAEAASRLLAVIDGLAPADSGGFFAHTGEALPW